ncbi:hypothetical protein CLF_110167 [Clonorchis sinensis]|uniref:BHLH domain-containing protein n=1 Tax=Clonorchis sinensis TaxID=79923 RepID=G7YT77_CLOSI|nr:hypothetical protein CLF_110167 [Clonorchis sinensis]
MSPSTLHKRRVGSESGKRSTGCKRGSRLRWIECERLKEIVPSVAGAECVNEVKVIKEAIKHISRLEEAVIQRLVSCDSEMPIGTSFPETIRHPTSSFALLEHHQLDAVHWFPSSLCNTFTLTCTQSVKYIDSQIKLLLTGDPAEEYHKRETQLPLLIGSNGSEYRQSYCERTSTLLWSSVLGSLTVVRRTQKSQMSICESCKGIQSYLFTSTSLLVNRTGFLQNEVKLTHMGLNAYIDLRRVPDPQGLIMKSFSELVLEQGVVCSDHDFRPTGQSTRDRRALSHPIRERRWRTEPECVEYQWDWISESEACLATRVELRLKRQNKNIQPTTRIRCWFMALSGYAAAVVSEASSELISGLCVLQIRHQILLFKHVDIDESHQQNNFIPVFASVQLHPQQLLGYMFKSRTTGFRICFGLGHPSTSALELRKVLT